MKYGFKKIYTCSQCGQQYSNLKDAKKCHNAYAEITIIDESLERELLQLMGA